MTHLTPTQALHGSAIIQALKQVRVEFVLSVPDICTSEGLLRPIANDPDLRLVRVCKEDEGVSVCAALSFCAKRSANALRAIAVDYRNPVCMMIGLLGKEPDVPPQQSARYGVRIITPMLDVLGIRHLVMSSDEDIPACMQAIDEAYEHSQPLAILFGRNPQ